MKDYDSPERRQELGEEEEEEEKKKKKKKKTPVTQALHLQLKSTKTLRRKHAI